MKIFNFRFFNCIMLICKSYAHTYDAFIMFFCLFWSLTAVVKKLQDSFSIVKEQHTGLKQDKGATNERFL